MKATLGNLLQAIFKDDLAQSKEMLKGNSDLARQSLSASFFEPRVHWFYPGDTALHAAAAGYRLEIARLLLESGANPCCANKLRRGQPLHYASDGHLESPHWNPARQAQMIELLLKAGAEPNAQDKNGATPLHRAVRTRCAEAVRCLLDAGSDPTLQNHPGSTPFHLAVQNTGRGGSGSAGAKAAQEQIIRLFIALGVSPMLKNASGKSVLDSATSDWIRNILTEASSDQGKRSRKIRP